MFPARRAPRAPLHAGKTRAGGRGREFYLLVGGLPFLLPARGPLTSPLLLLANCDAADTLVMFSASFVRPLPAPNLPLLPAAHTIFGIAGGGPVKRETRRRIYFASGMLLLLLLPSTMEFEGSCPPKPPSSSSSRPRGAMILIRNSIGLFLSFFGNEISFSSKRFLNFPTKMDE